MTDPEVMLRAGGRLRKIRLRLGLSIREVARKSLKLVTERHNREFNLSRAWLNDIEKGRFVPGTFKTVSLGAIYGLTIAQIHKLYGADPGDIVKQEPFFRPPKTHLLTSPDEDTPEAGGEPPGPQKRGPKDTTDLVTRLLDIWGEAPVPMLRHIDLRRSLFGYIGFADKTMVPLLPPGTLVQIDPKQTRVQTQLVKPAATRSQFGRPIYFLDIRTGYACGWCEVKNGVLTLIPHPESGEPTRTFRYPSEVSVVGRVTRVALDITERAFTSIEKREGENGPQT